MFNFLSKDALQRKMVWAYRPPEKIAENYESLLFGYMLVFSVKYGGALHLLLFTYSQFGDPLHFRGLIFVFDCLFYVFLVVPQILIGLLKANLVSAFTARGTTLLKMLYLGTVAAAIGVAIYIVPLLELRAWGLDKHGFITMLLVSLMTYLGITVISFSSSILLSLPFSLVAYLRQRLRK